MLSWHGSRLSWCEESAESGDLTGSELASVTGILFKDTDEWREAYRDLRRTLAEREHVPSAGERRRRRAEQVRRGT